MYFAANGTAFIEVIVILNTPHDCFLIVVKPISNLLSPDPCYQKSSSIFLITPKDTVVFPPLQVMPHIPLQRLQNELSHLVTGLTLLTLIKHPDLFVPHANFFV